MTRVTGFAEGLFEGDELSSGAIKGKPAKEAWLEKILEEVEEATGDPLFTQPSKMVCGQEPEQTNLFLQALASAAEDCRRDAAGGAAGEKASGEEAKAKEAMEAKENEKGKKAKEKAAEEKAKEKKAREKGAKKKNEHEEQKEQEAAAPAGPSLDELVEGTRRALGAIVTVPLAPPLLRKPPFPLRPARVELALSWPRTPSFRRLTVRNLAAGFCTTWCCR